MGKTVVAQCGYHITNWGNDKAKKVFGKILKKYTKLDLFSNKTVCPKVLKQPI